MNFRPTQVKWQLMVASCYRRSGMNLTILIHLISLAISFHLSAFRVMIYVFHLFSGNYQKALETYKDIHRKFPENVECNVLNTTVFFPFDSLCLSSSFASHAIHYLSGRSTLPGQAVHWYGTKRGAGLCHQTEESWKNEGDQRAGTLISLGAVYIWASLASLKKRKQKSESEAWTKNTHNCLD